MQIIFDCNILQVTHDVLSHKNYFGQTLLALIEINQESLLESLIIVIRLELDLHNSDIRLAENCLRNHLQSSESTHAIISLLHQQVPASLCYKVYNWTVLILVTLITGVGLTFFDIYSDIFISTEYYRNMTNQTAVDFLNESCSDTKLFNDETIGFKLPTLVEGNKFSLGMYKILLCFNYKCCFFFLQIVSQTMMKFVISLLFTKKNHITHAPKLDMIDFGVLPI